MSITYNMYMRTATDANKLNAAASPTGKKDLYSCLSPDDDCDGILRACAARLPAPSRYVGEGEAAVDEAEGQAGDRRQRVAQEVGVSTT